jgi:hypothetical protein
MKSIWPGLPAKTLTPNNRGDKMAPKSFKKSNAKKKIKACKTGTASEAIGKIEKGTDTFILTYGQFSLIDSLIAILDQTGPAHVVISTWTAAHAHLDRSEELLRSADILSFRMIVDRSFKSRQPAYYSHMIDLFGEDSVRAIRTHAKFMTIRNDAFDIVVRTSMNLNENPRLENIEVSENKEFCEFFEQIANDIFSEVKPGENKSDLPGLENVKESSPYKLVKGETIKRRNLNGVKITHQMQIG